jgi:hypothetical protein
MKSFKSGIAIATAAAALFSTGLLVTTQAQAADGGVKCTGINSCKGTSECKTAKSECKGQNGCKGQGWTSAKSAKECTDAGGKVAK